VLGNNEKKNKFLSQNFNLRASIRLSLPAQKTPKNQKNANKTYHTKK